MGGYAGDHKPKSLRRTISGPGGGDPCDIQIEVDLVGLRSEVSRSLNRDDLLRVALVRSDGATSVVCKTLNGRAVGALAAFRGLAQLINCSERGTKYQALVIFASSTRCAVQVTRVNT